MGELLKDIYVPETVAHSIVNSLQSEGAEAEAERQRRIEGIHQRLAALRSRVDKMYEDKLDGKVDEGLWTRKTNEWREQERKLESELSSVKMTVPAENTLRVEQIFELANKAHFLYLTRNSSDRGRLLKSVLLKLVYVFQWRCPLVPLSRVQHAQKAT